MLWCQGNTSDALWEGRSGHWYLSYVCWASSNHDARTCETSRASWLTLDRLHQTHGNGWPEDTLKSGQPSLESAHPWPEGASLKSPCPHRPWCPGSYWSGEIRSKEWFSIARPVTSSDEHLCEPWAEPRVSRPECLSQHTRTWQHMPPSLCLLPHRSTTAFCHYASHQPEIGRELNKKLAENNFDSSKSLQIRARDPSWSVCTERQLCACRRDDLTINKPLSCRGRVFS